MNRRSLIALSGAFGASCAIGHRFARSTGGGYPFTLGVPPDNRLPTSSYSGRGLRSLPLRPMVLASRPR